MRILREVLRQYRAAAAVCAVLTAAGAAVFYLYGVFMEPLIYVAVLGMLLLAALLAAGWVREKRRDTLRVRALRSADDTWRCLPAPRSLAEEEYQSMIAALGAVLERATAEADAGRQEQMDYYTAWVHQIKTPIAVMRLMLSDDTPEHRALSSELDRVERYVDMALQYIRLDSRSSDLVIREHSLDELIRACVRRQAAQFVEKRLALHFTPTEATVVTDGKWLSCILDQLLSNAAKYTDAGSVTIEMHGGLLTVSDTGIGIAPEDLPRIFEKGFTGLNGRLGEKSSGLGLYLARKAADLLAIPLSVESAVGAGSAFTLDLRQEGASL